MMVKMLKRLLTFVGLGFILGLLFAPEKGDETRKKVNEAIEKGKEKIEEVKKSFKTPE